MKPVVFRERAAIPGGLWSPKLNGTFEEGDAKTDIFFIGSASIKQFSDLFKLFFTEVDIVDRNEINRFLGKSSKAGNDDQIDIAQTLKMKSKYVDVKERILPKLFMYLCKKKPKTRMVDVHKNGTKIPLNKLDSGGYFGRPKTLGNFEVSLNEVAEVLDYKGLVIIKLPNDPPVTEEPVIYGFIKFHSAHNQKIKTGIALHFSELQDLLRKSVTLSGSSGTRGAGNAAREITTLEMKQQSDKNAIKSIDSYRRTAMKIWMEFEKNQDEKVTFPVFLQMLEQCSVILVRTQALRIFQGVDIGGIGEIGLSEFENALMINDVLGLVTEIPLLDIFDSIKATPNEIIYLEGEGLDISGFCEALNMLGCKDTDQAIANIFCDILKCKSNQMANKVLTHEQFKKAWVKLADVELELQKRGAQMEFSLISANRNRDQLYRIVSSKESEYLSNLSRLNTFVEKVKQDKRAKKDARRAEAEAFRDKLVHAAGLFSAVRSQEKRLLIKKEQEERSRKRIEDKVLRNTLLQRQAEHKLKQREDLAADMRNKERLKLDEVRALGWDKFDHSVSDWHDIPLEMYVPEEAQMRLSYAIVMDLSRNKIDSLPEAGFFYCCASLRKAKLTQNRLRQVPEEICDLVSLENLEIDSNRLKILPLRLGQLTSLQRLNLSNNLLTFLPEDISHCISLKHLNLHTNKLTRIPTSIGTCGSLEYLNLSRNQLIELPEDLEFLYFLSHLDISTNNLSHFPHNVGNCRNLKYICASSNNIGFIPDSFSSLSNLQVCILDHNQIISTPIIFNGLNSLVECNLHCNRFIEIFEDFGNCHSLSKADFSNNRIKSITVEIGLLKQLEHITFSHNELSGIPPELGACSQLLSLNVSHNLLSGELPGTIGLMNSLHKFDFSHNQVETIPRSIIGLTELRELVCAGNRLLDVPDTMSYLTNLTAINLNSNSVARFPVELHHISTLRRLEMNSNLMQLLPRNINTLSFLDYLDISNNALKALPVQFCEIFESVPTVLLNANPWSDFPPIWNKIWSLTSADDHPNGYSVSDAVNLLYGMRIFYDTADDIWREHGAFHYANRLDLRDFLLELQTRLPHSWHSGLEDYAKYLYFKAKEFGVFPIWYCTTESMDGNIKERMRLDAMKRAQNVVLVKEEEVRRQAKKLAIYSNNVVRRAERSDEVHLELRLNEEIKRNIALGKLYSQVKTAEVKINEFGKKRRAERQRAAEEEMGRLLEVTKTVTEEHRQELFAPSKGKSTKTKALLKWW